MSEELSIRSLKSIFRFPFEGPQWQGRLAIGSALMLVSMFLPVIPILFVGGYALRIMRQTLAGQAPTLPEWDEWGELFGDGLRAFVVNLVYFLPAILVWVVGMTLYFVGSFYLPFVASTGADEAEMVGTMLAWMFGSMAVMFLSMALGMLLTLLGAIAWPVATAHFAAHDNLRAAFRLRQWWRILKADKLGYFIAWVIVAGLLTVLYTGSLLLYSTMVLCFLIPFLTAPLGFYVALVGAALFGATYREAAATLASQEIVAQG